MKSKKVIFSLFVMLYALSSSAYDALIDGIYYNFEGTSAIVTNSGSTGCYQGDIVIPSSVTYNGNLYSVTSIGENSFYSCTNLTSVTISEGVKGIDKYAFSWCGKLMRVTIPFSVKNIGESAFSNCSGVIDVVNCNIPDCTWNTVEASYFPTGIFCGSNIRELVLGEDVTYIGNSAFAGCKQLVSLTCKAQKVPTLGTFVFAGGGGTWYHNSNVPLSEATLYVPASSLEAYRNADQWKEFGTILPIDETQIPSATSISLNQTEATMEIGTTLQLTATILPKEAVQTAEWSSSDASIASVNSNGVVTAVSSGTATITAKTTDGSNLTARCAVTVDELDPTVLIAGECGNGVTYSLNASGVLTFSGSGTINFDSNNRPWREYLNQIKIIIIPEGVTSICSYAFRDCKSLTSITLPSSLRTISDHAFVNCEGLTELVIPEGVESIGEYAFEGLKNLQSAKLPSSIQSLGKEIFKNSTGTVYVKCNIPDARWGG
nr:leucine-rich repeat protein [Bacteroidaceae bacterium]